MSAKATHLWFEIQVIGFVGRRRHVRMQATARTGFRSDTEDSHLISQLRKVRVSTCTIIPGNKPAANAG